MLKVAWCGNSTIWHCLRVLTAWGKHPQPGSFQTEPHMQEQTQTEQSDTKGHFSENQTAQPWDGRQNLGI